jgi:ATP-dependent DNA helicase RecG
LLVHLPLRYEDETRITPVARAPWGEPVQVEVVVQSNEMQFPAPADGGAGGDDAAAN